jgi:hypothetical protein
MNRIIALISNPANTMSRAVYFPLLGTCHAEQEMKRRKMPQPTIFGFFVTFSG